MFDQSRSEAQVTPPVTCLFPTMSGTTAPRDVPHVIRFVVDGVPISVVVSRRLDGRSDAGEGSLVLKSGLRSDNGATVFLTSPSLHEGLSGLHGDLGRDAIVTGAAGLYHDPVMEGLARALVARGDVGHKLGSTYTNAVCAALVTRLIALWQVQGANVPSARCKTALPKWRLKKVVEFIDVHLSNRISLADMAERAGLTRMHFAAQFRLATGVRPHEYLLRRRVERAQRLLRQSDRTLVDIALSVGFQTQAHFTTVFKRYAGQTPMRWRQASQPVTELAA